MGPCGHRAWEVTDMGGIVARVPHPVRKGRSDIALAMEPEHRNERAAIFIAALSYPGNIDRLLVRPT